MAEPLLADAVNIDDPADGRVEVFLGLRDPVLRQRREAPGGDMDGVFIAEGDIVIERALAAGFELVALLFDARRSTAFPFPIVDACHGAAEPVRIISAGPNLLAEISGFSSYRGAMACFARRPSPELGPLLADAATVLVTEGVNNPTNMGVMMRSGAALGIDAVVFDPTSCDVFSRRCCRVSMGAVFDLPATRLGPLPDALDELHDHGFHTVALTPATDAVDIGELAFAADDKVALLVGAEGPGLTPATLGAARTRAQIPMARAVDSLNVGAAAAVAFYALGQARS